MTSILVAFLMTGTVSESCQDIHAMGVGWSAIHRLMVELREAPPVADAQYDISIVIRWVRRHDIVTQILGTDMEQSALEQRRADGTRIRTISRMIRETAIRDRLFEWTRVPSRDMQEATEGARQLGLVFTNWAAECQAHHNND